MNIGYYHDLRGVNNKNVLPPFIEIYRALDCHTVDKRKPKNPLDQSTRL